MTCQSPRRRMADGRDERFVTLWPSELEAKQAPSQTGASNCGEAAVRASLMALRIAEHPGGGVTVRARDYGTRSLTAYLKSRSLAGCTGADLVDGAFSLSGGKAEAKFFATGPEPPVGLLAWLAEWIESGAAPIVTINTQLDGADYWHHQAVLGVRPDTQQITLANPFEHVSEAEVARLLGSSSVLLVMPSDVLQRCPPPAEELEMLRADPRYAALDVAGHVEKMMANRSGGAKLAIPASYLPGITLICPVGSEAALRLKETESPWSRAMHEPITEAL